MIAARGAGDKGALKLSADTGGAPWEVDVPLAAAADRNGVSKLWARKKIAALELDRARPGAEHDVLEKQILDTALAHHLISRLTSLVAVDVTSSRPDGEALASVDLPLNLPKGWEFEKVFGETSAPVQRDAFAPGLLKTRQAASDPAAAPAMQAGPGAALPHGATFADAKMIRGLMLILMALLLLVCARPFPAAARR